MPMKMKVTPTFMVMDKKKICSNKLRTTSMVHTNIHSSTTTTAEILDTIKSVIKVDTGNSLHPKRCIIIWLYRSSASRLTVMQLFICQAITMDHIQKCTRLHRCNANQCMVLTHHLEWYIQLSIDTHTSIR